VNIYVSGSWTARGRLRTQAEKLRACGHRITSSWLDEQDKPAHLPLGEWLTRLAHKDIAEVAGSDMIILDVDTASTTGGRYVEWGVACHPHALIRRVLVGTPPPLDIFGRMADYHFSDWNALFASGLIPDLTEVDRS
jgi:hypothetical protein